MKKLSLAILLLLSLFSEGQHTHFYNRIPGKYLVVFIEPAALLDFYNGPGLRLGTEYSINKMWSVSGTAGVYFEQGYMIRGELKRYYINRDNRLYFFSLAYLNAWHIHQANDFYRKPDPTEGYVADKSRPVNYLSDKHINNINLVWGYDLFWNHHWWFEVYTGAGIKFKTVNNNISDAIQDQLYHFHESVIDNLSFTSGRITTLSIMLGIKTGILFARQQAAAGKM